LSVPALRVLRVTDPSEPWTALGFDIRNGGLSLGGVRVEFLPGRERGIVSWGLEGVSPQVPSSIDGLATEGVLPAQPEGVLPAQPESVLLATEGLLPAQPVPAAQPNGALGIDHVVVTTPDFDRTARALEQAGLGLRRVRDGERGRQGFRRLGPAILELVEVGAPDRSGPARFWGLVVIVSDLEALAERLGDHLGRPRAAVQPGRRIATLRPSAGIGPALAFMTPEPG
jgi:hypothetical protein